MLTLKIIKKRILFLSMFLIFFVFFINEGIEVIDFYFNYNDVLKSEINIKINELSDIINNINYNRRVDFFTDEGMFPNKDYVLFKLINNTIKSNLKFFNIKEQKIKIKFIIIYNNHHKIRFSIFRDEYINYNENNIMIKNLEVWLNEQKDVHNIIILPFYLKDTSSITKQYGWVAISYDLQIIDKILEDFNSSINKTFIVGILLVIFLPLIINFVFREKNYKKI